MPELINILTRTSNRPLEFLKLRESLESQTFKNYHHIVCYDCEDSLSYLKSYSNLNNVSLVKVEHLTRRTLNEFPYNLYLNQLYDEVKEGWIMFIDDDDRLHDNHSLEVLAHCLESIPDDKKADSLVLWKVLFPHRRTTVPSDRHFGNELVELEISSAGFCFHRSQVKHAIWDGMKEADFRVTKNLHQNTSNHVWLNEIITSVQTKLRFGNNGVLSKLFSLRSIGIFLKLRHHLHEILKSSFLKLKLLLSIPTNKKLPGLTKGLNSKFVSTLIKQNFNPFTFNVLKFYPNHSCTIQYPCKKNEDCSIICKLYQNGHGAEVYQKWLSLWNESKRVQSLPLNIAQPLHFDAELEMLLIKSVPGEHLRSALQKYNPKRLLELAAVNTAALHSIKSDLIPNLDTNSYLKTYCTLTSDMRTLIPDNEQGNIERLLEKVSFAVHQSSAELCTIHGDLGLEHTFIYDNVACFIDLDEACIANPALDIGNFIVSLDNFLSSNLLARCFLDKYLQYREIDLKKDLNPYIATAYLRRSLGFLRRRQTLLWRTKGQTMLAKAQAALDGLFF